jgi:hypothetical protein
MIYIHHIQHARHALTSSIYLTNCCWFILQYVTPNVLSALDVQINANFCAFSKNFACAAPPQSCVVAQQMMVMLSAELDCYSVAVPSSNPSPCATTRTSVSALSAGAPSRAQMLCLVQWHSCA